MVNRPNSSRSQQHLQHLLLAAASAALFYLQHAAAQTSQNGLLYWCSLIENGNNMNSTGFSPSTLPRTTYAAYAQGYYSRMCHLNTVASSGQPYTFTNGSSYPSNSNGPPVTQYAVNPNWCQVRLNLWPD